MFPDYLVRLVALEPLRAGVPGDHVTLGVESEDRVVADALHQKLVKTGPLEARYRDWRLRGRRWMHAVGLMHFIEECLESGEQRAYLVERYRTRREAEPPRIPLHTECLKGYHRGPGSVQQERPDVLVGLEAAAVHGLPMEPELRRKVDRPLRIDRIDRVARALKRLDGFVTRPQPPRTP